MTPLFDPALLFRVQLRPVRTQLKFGTADWRLPDEAVLPAIGPSVSGQSDFASFRLAVSESALFVSAYVTGKRQSLWCRDSVLESSDGLHLWIDTAIRARCTELRDIAIGLSSLRKGEVPSTSSRVPAGCHSSSQREFKAAGGTLAGYPRGS